MSNPLHVCRWCGTLPNGDDKSCTEYSQAMNCAWLPRADREALARYEQERKDELVRRAAPDMLAALIECTNRFTYTLQELRGLLAEHPIDELQDEAANEADEDALDRARAAIAKATGGTLTDAHASKSGGPS